jgi:hypothetical protein
LRSLFYSASSGLCVQAEGGGKKCRSQFRPLNIKSVGHCLHCTAQQDR